MAKKYKNTIPINPSYDKDEIVTHTKETAIAQMFKNAIALIRRRIGDIHNVESGFSDNQDPKFITNLADAIGSMANIVPPLNKAKLLAYAPHLYTRMQNATYNVIPHPDQDNKCWVGCIYDHYNFSNQQTQCAFGDTYAQFYRKNPDDGGICRNHNCPKWSGQATSLHEIEQIADNVQVDKVRKYKIVLPEEERSGPKAIRKYYDNCGSELGEPHRIDAEDYNTGDCSLDGGDPWDPGTSYACNTLGNEVRYKFPDIKPGQDREYYMVFEIPPSGNGNITVKVSGTESSGYIEVTDSPFSSDSGDHVLSSYLIPSHIYESSHEVYAQFTKTTGGGDVSQIWIIEVSNETHFNHGEQLLLPYYLKAVVPYNEYPSNSMFLFDTEENTTIGHCRFYSSYFRNFTDTERLHRDCVDVFVYGDSELSTVENTRYLIYTGGLGVADLAGGLLEDFISHVGNRDIHLTTEDVCKIVNDPTICCEYEDPESTLSYKYNVGLELDGPLVNGEEDLFEYGRAYAVRMNAFRTGEAIENLGYRWTITKPSGSTITGLSDNMMIMFDERGTWNIEGMLHIPVGEEGYYETLNIREDFTVFVQANANPITTTADPKCDPGDDGCYEWANIVYLTFLDENHNCISPGASFNDIGDMKADVTVKAPWAEAGKPVHLYYRMKARKKDAGAWVILDDWVGPVNMGITPFATSTTSVTIPGDSTASHPDYLLWKYGCVATHEDFDGMIYMECRAVFDEGGDDEYSASDTILFHMGMPSIGVVTNADHRIQGAAWKQCLHTAGHYYLPNAINCAFGATRLEDDLLSGLVYSDSGHVVGGEEFGWVEGVYYPIFYCDIGNMFDNINPENLEHCVLILNVSSVSGDGSWSTDLADHRKKVYLDIFDMNCVEIRSNEDWNEVYLGYGTPKTNPNKYWGLDNYAGNTQTVNCSYSGSAWNSQAPDVPNVDDWFDSDWGSPRSINLYGNINNNNCQNLDGCCGYNPIDYDKMQLHGNGFYSLVTQRPFNYQQTLSGSDVPRFGYPLGAYDYTTAYVNSPWRGGSMALPGVSLPLVSDSDKTITTGAVGFDITNRVKAMMETYKQYSSGQYKYYLPTKLGFRIVNPFPFNASTREDRYVTYKMSQTGLWISYEEGTLSQS